MFIRDNRGATSVEYVVIAALAALILAIAFVALFNTIQTKLMEINSSL